MNGEARHRWLAHLYIRLVQVEVRMQTLSEYKTARVLGGQFYLDCMKLGGNLPRVNDRRRSAYQRVLDAYTAMTSEEEAAPSATRDAA